MAEKDLVPFTSQNSTVYRGAGRGFVPGELTLVPRGHLADLQAHDARSAPPSLVATDDVAAKTAQPAATARPVKP